MKRIRFFSFREIELIYWNEKLFKRKSNMHIIVDLRLVLQIACRKHKHEVIIVIKIFTMFRKFV